MYVYAVENHPEGYPRVAVYLNSQDGSALFRRFGDLHIRSLLYKQVELTELERKLAKIDAEDDFHEENRWRNGYSIHHNDGKHNEERKALIDEIDKKLDAYGYMPSALQDLG
jgi:hypothetical protein